MVVEVPATSANLGAGFDCLGLAIDFKNQTEVKKSRFASVSVKGEGAEFLKTKSNNIFLDIFNDKFKALTDEKQDFRFVFNNHIPISRGLGSSSAVIIAAIAAAYKAAGKGINKEKILNDALVYESHPDNIAPAVHGGFCTAVVENKKVRVIKTDISDDVKAVVVIPDKPMSTKKARTTLPTQVSHKDASFNIGRSSLFTAAMISKNYELLRVSSQDKLHQSNRMKNLSVLFEVQELGLKNGALMSTLSGSGSTFFNMTYKDDALVLRDKYRKKYPNFRVEVFDFDNDGVVAK
ncbi:MAG: homoserine kinase [Campylobacterales bacterium]|nr:homoserine kinase [Campylobacterales bacterium]